MRIQDVCTLSARSCSKDATLAEVGRLMRATGLGFLPVVDETGRVVGVVTDRDLLKALMLAERPAESIPLQGLLGAPLVTCRLTDGVRDALRIMRTMKIHRLPVVDGAGVLQGVVSFGDLALAARPERQAGPTDLTDEDIVLALKLLCADRPRLEAPIPDPQPALHK